MAKLISGEKWPSGKELIHSVLNSYSQVFFSDQPLFGVAVSFGRLIIRIDSTRLACSLLDLDPIPWPPQLNMKMISSIIMMQKMILSISN
jgi:hypothetical protein